MKYIRRNSFYISIIIIAALFMLMVFKGDKDVFYYQNTYDTKVGGPFELTNSTSRYALLEALVENRSVFFTESQAKRSAPDISYHNGRYFSIFTPGISFLSIPFYIIGKLIGYQQHITFLLNIFAQLINIVLIAILSTKFGVSLKKGILSGLIFAFATNSLTYSLTLAQHNVTAMFTLIAILNASNKKRTWKNNSILGSIYGISGLVDIPNFFILLPSMLYAFYNSFVIENKLNFKPRNLAIVISMGITFLPFFIGFGIFNKTQTGSYLDNGQFIGRSSYPAEELTKTAEEIQIEASKPKTRHTPLYTRDQMRNLYLLTISNERGILFYSPIVIIGIIGLYIAYFNKKYKHLVSLIVGTTLVTLALYSMHGDPWGGWAFSSRYMIVPSALILSCLGIIIERYKKSFVFQVLFLAILGYSLYVSSLGALTTNAIPPKIEAIHLIVPIPYTYEYNQKLIQEWNSSLFYNAYISDIASPLVYFYIYLMLVSTVILFVYFKSLYEKN